MPVANIRLPDGSVMRRHFREGTTPQQIEAHVFEHVYKNKPLPEEKPFVPSGERGFLSAPGQAIQQAVDNVSIPVFNRYEQQGREYGPPNAEQAAWDGLVTANKAGKDTTAAKEHLAGLRNESTSRAGPLKFLGFE